jgi:putative aminopeptidase FrvX
MQEFLLAYIKKASVKWKKKPKIVYGDFQDALVLIFGKPKTAIFAHMDTTGFMVRYNKELTGIGGPAFRKNDELATSKNDVSKISISGKEPNQKIKTSKNFPTGTSLVYAPHYKLQKGMIESPYLDNRIGLWLALKLAENMENGAIAFTAQEESGGGSAEVLTRYLFEKHGIRQALIADVTWVTEGVKEGLGPVVSLRDKFIPRKKFIDQILSVAEKNKLRVQKEVERFGSSDGGYIQKSGFPVDWCFIGPAGKEIHSSREKVSLNDCKECLTLLDVLIKTL